MNELSLSCDNVRDLAAELALDALPGDERAAVLAHLDGCPACREHVDALSRAADDLLLALPEEDVPELLSARLHRSVPPPSATSSSDVVPGARTRWRMITAAAAAIVIIVTGALLVTSRSSDAPPEGVGDFALLATGGSNQDGAIGLVTITDTPWFTMTVDGATGTGMFSCVLSLEGGEREEIGKFSVTDGQGEWEKELDVSPERIEAADLVDTSGAVVATAQIG